MDDPIKDFEKRCADLGVKPVDAVRRAGVSESTWFRWKADTCGPTFRKIRAINGALDAMAGERSGQCAA